MRNVIRTKTPLPRVIVDNKVQETRMYAMISFDVSALSKRTTIVIHKFHVGTRESCAACAFEALRREKMALL